MSQTVTIVLRIKQGTRYPFYPIVKIGNRIKPQWCLVNGIAEHHPERRFYLRYRLNGKDKCEPSGTANVFDAETFAKSVPTS